MAGQMHNRSFAQPVNDGRGLVYAPIILHGSPHPPTEAEYNAEGWYRLAIDPPAPPEGHMVANTRYMVSDGRLIAEYTYEPLPPPTLEDFDAAMENHLKGERCARGYTTREPDVYLTSNVERWAQDALDWVAHRDAVMEYALELINAVKAGEREPPTMAEFMEGLPRIRWTIEDDSSGSDSSSGSGDLGDSGAE